MAAQKNSIQKCLVEAVRDKVKEDTDNKSSWTIYFLVDLKVVYIITYAYISIVNLISSTANSEATSDKNSMRSFDVTDNDRNVIVASITDAVLWNCRALSETDYYYRFLYWMLIVAMTVAMSGFFITKFVALITVSSGCGHKQCGCMCSSLKHTLTKLWHIAMHEQLMKPKGYCEQLPQKVTNGCTSNGQQLQVGESTLEEGHSKEDKKRESTSEGQQVIPSKKIQVVPENYPEMLHDHIPNQIIKELSCYKNFFRLMIPYLLLILLVAIMVISYLSYDLHPLACILQEKGANIAVVDRVNGKVKLDFKDSLINYQIAAGFVVLALSSTFLICVGLFYCFTKLVIEDIKKAQEKVLQYT